MGFIKEENAFTSNKPELKTSDANRPNSGRQVWNLKQILYPSIALTLWTSKRRIFNVSHAKSFICQYQSGCKLSSANLSSGGLLNYYISKLKILFVSLELCQKVLRMFGLAIAYSACIHTPTWILDRKQLPCKFHWIKIPKKIVTGSNTLS